MSLMSPGGTRFTFAPIQLVWKSARSLRKGEAIQFGRADGLELFYRSAAKMMAVSVRTEGGLVLGRPTMLYERPFTPTFWPTFAVAPDGQQIIDLENADTEPAPTELILVQNWFQELERLVPTND